VSRLADDPPFWTEAWRLSALRVLAMYLRHTPPHPGRWRLALRAVSLAPVLKRSTRPRVVRIPGGGRLEVDGSSQTGRILYATGEYEPATARLITASLRPGDLMVDVGANIGFFSILAARRVGPSGRVLAFEPAAPVRARLEANLRLNGLDNVDVRGDALGAATGPTTFYPGPSTDTGLASCRPLPASASITIDQVRFDDLTAGLPAVRLIKIDVEGAELNVLQGMSACLRRDRPDLIVEFTDAFLRALGGSAEALHAFLCGHGYAVSLIREDGALEPIPDATHLARCPGQFNAFCSAR
jgi:FkbM family methyltransferase